MPPARDDLAEISLIARTKGHEGEERARRMRITAIAMSSLLVVGCATIIPNLPTVPRRGQSAEQTETDARTCAASAHCTICNDPRAATEYASCMISRGYRVPVPAGFFADVEATRYHEAPVVREQIATCQEQAAGIVTPAERTRSVVYTVVGGMFLMNVEGLSERMLAAFTACLEPEGYTVTRWEPPSDASTRR